MSRAVPGQAVTPMTMHDVEQRPAEQRRQHDRQRQERDHQEPLGQPEEHRCRPSRRSSPTRSRSGCRAPSRSSSRSARPAARPGRPRSAASAPSGRTRRCPARYSDDGGSEDAAGRLGRRGPRGRRAAARQIATTAKKISTNSPNMPDRFRRNVAQVRGPPGADAAGRAGVPRVSRRGAVVMCRTLGSSHRTTGWRPGWRDHAGGEEQEDALQQRESGTRNASVVSRPRPGSRTRSRS